MTITAEDGSGLVAVAGPDGETTMIAPVEDLRGVLAAQRSPVLNVSEGQSVIITAELSTTCRLLHALSPDPELEDALELALDDSGDRIHELEAFGSVRINGDEWGWLKDYRGWKPAPKGDGSEVARMSAWMSASMTGAALSAGIRAWPNGTAMVWFDDDDSNPEGDSVQMEYAVEDWDELAVRLGGFFRSWYDEICPYCEEGWEIDGSFDERFGVDALRQIVSLTWRPCEDHIVNTTEDEVEFAGRWWAWDGEGWHPD